MLQENKPPVKSCHVCEFEKPLGSFIYFNSKRQAIESTVCSCCHKELRRIDVYCNKILEGVFIPLIEKPIVKYSTTIFNSEVLECQN